MNINVSKAEFKTLLRMSAIAQFVMGMDTSIPDRTRDQKDADAMLEKLMQSAPEFGLQDCVEKEDGKYVPTEEYYEDVFEILNEYDAYAFYEKGAELLAWRDIRETFTQKEFEAKSEEERYALVFESRMKYISEWENHDYDRLRIVEED